MRPTSILPMAPPIRATYLNIIYLPFLSNLNNNFMDFLGFEEEAISPLLPPATFVHHPKVLILKSAKLSQLPTCKSFKSSIDEGTTTINIDILTQSPLRKRRLINSKRPLSKHKGNNSLLHSSTAITYQKPQKKPRPMSSNIKPLFSKRKSINLDQKRYTKSPSARTYIRPFMPPNGLTAYSYIIMETNLQIHISWNSKTMVEIASLTKIMTCLCILNLIKTYHLNKDDEIEVGMVESSIIGTTARLRKGYRYTIKQLLYGLMLPSGNDASLALAVWGGKVLINNNWKPETSISKKRQAIALFVEYMNHTAKELELKKTKFSNPHGLPSPDNKSTAYDMAVLCRVAMQNQEFRRIVSTKQHSTHIINDFGQKEEITWKNTHKLLRKDCYLGVKTGTTVTAGACLSSYITANGRSFIIIVLNCKKLQRRFKETQILRRWLYKKEGFCKTDNKSADFQMELEEDVQDDGELYNQ